MTATGRPRRRRDGKPDLPREQKGEDKMTTTGVKVFITGGPRTGTSAMYMAMRHVFNLPGQGESHLTPIFWQMLGQFEKYQADRRANEGLLLHFMDGAEVRDAFCALLRDFYWRRYPQGSWVDKTPTAEATRSYHLVRHAFPDARFIVTTRTGTEFVRSFVKKFPNTNFDQACRNWMGTMLANIWAEEKAEGALIVDQFDMTNRADETAERICIHLGVPEKQANLADFFRSERVDSSASRDWSRRMTLEETGWTDAEKERFVAICGGMMQRLGYPM